MLSDKKDYFSNFTYNVNIIGWLIFIKTFNLTWERNLFYCSQSEEIHIQGSTYYWLVIIYTNLKEICDTNSIAKAKVYVSPIIAPNSQSVEN